jgi:hypothetical protein
VLVAAGLLTAAGRLLVAAAIPATPVTTLRFTRRFADSPTAVSPCGSTVACGAAASSVTGGACTGTRRDEACRVRPFGRSAGLLVEAELLPGSVRADTAAHGVTEAGRRACSDA